MARRTKRTIQMQPTSLRDQADEKYAYADSALINLLNVHGAQVNSARQLMWQRYSAFLFASSVFMPLITRIEQPIIQLLASVVGSMICKIWSEMLRADRQVLIWRIETANRFTMLGQIPDANPFFFMLRPEQLEHAHKIYKLAYQLILCFIGMYVALYGYSLLALAKTLATLIR